MCIRDRTSSEPKPMLINTDEKDNYLYMMIVPVLLTGPKGTREELAILDPGSTSTVIEEELACKLGLQGTPSTFRYKGVDTKVNVEKSMTVDLKISTLEGEEFYPLKKVRTLKTMDLAKQSLTESEIKKWDY